MLEIFIYINRLPTWKTNGEGGDFLRSRWKHAVAGGLAGMANGFFGGGGGMLLVPLLGRWCGLEQRKAFATSVAVILPLCPDKGSCMSYDLSRAASTYLDNDIEMLRRLQASFKIVIGG